MDETWPRSEDQPSLSFDDPPLSEIEKKAARHGGWALELARWYEADWQLALTHGRSPKAARVLEAIDPSRRGVAIELFHSIDTRYGHASGEADRETIDLGRNDATTDVPTPGPLLEPTVDPEADTASANPNRVPQPEPDDTVDFVPRASAPSPQDSFPDIPGYSVHRVLGRGGMGVVYLARQENIERWVALKMVLSGRHSSKRTLDRFHAEARAVGRFQHENIVRIFDSGVHDDLPYFSLEFIDGQTLGDLIKVQPLDPIEAARLLIPIARALDYAHDKGVIHRDIKPGNVLLTRERTPKISDFGLSKQLEEDNEFSRTGDIVGTPSYMAPEQARGDHDVGPSADIYAAGALLYCMLTGRPPFHAAKATDTLLQVIQDEPISPARLQPNVGKDLETICLKCLHKSPSERYATAGEFAEDLQRFVNDEPIVARPVGRLERVWRWAKRNPKLAATASTAAVLAVILSIGGPAAAGIIYQQKGEVEYQRSVAEQNAEDAERNAEDAQRNAEEAKANADLATTQEKLAINALKRMANKVQKDLRYVPNVQPTRMAILDATREALEDMEKVGQDRTSHQQIDAIVQARKGEISMLLGRVLQAERYFQKSLAILQQLEEEGALLNRHHNYSTIYEYLGRAASKSGRLVQSRDYWERALEYRREWVAAEPDNENVRQNLAATLGSVGWVALDQGELNATQGYLLESLEIREEFLEEHPERTDAQANVLGAKWSLAKVDFLDGKRRAAQEQLVNVIAELEKLVRDSPYSFQHRQNVCLALLDLGDVLIYSGDRSEALATYQDSATRLRKLIEEDPENVPHQRRLANAVYRISVANSDDQEASQKTMREALDIRMGLYEGEPDNLTCQTDLLLVMARLGMLQEMADILVAAERQIRQDAGMYYRLAGVYSLIAEALDNGAEPPAPIWTVDAANGLAVGAIKKATDMGFRRLGDLKYDPDLDFVRKTDAYQTLLAKLE